MSSIHVPEFEFLPELSVRENMERLDILREREEIRQEIESGAYWAEFYDD